MPTTTLVLLLFVMMLTTAMAMLSFVGCLTEGLLPPLTVGALTLVWLRVSVQMLVHHQICLQQPLPVPAPAGWLAPGVWVAAGAASAAPQDDAIRAHLSRGVDLHGSQDDDVHDDVTPAHISRGTSLHGGPDADEPARLPRGVAQLDEATCRPAIVSGEEPVDVTEVLGLDLDDLSVRVALLEDTTRKAAEESATDCMQLQIQSLSTRVEASVEALTKTQTLAAEIAARKMVEVVSPVAKCLLLAEKAFATTDPRGYRATCGMTSRRSLRR